jgi:GNAT superfamily N-acetyltransferase
MNINEIQSPKIKITDNTLTESVNKVVAINEGYKLQLERDTDMMVLHITDTATGKRTEVRGKSGYETGGYDSTDSLHILLDKIGKSANISDLMNGDTVGINPKHPKGASAKTATTKAFNEAKDGLPVKTLKGLYHVGTLDASKKRDGFEGAGISVSTHPNAWKQIARGHVTGDTHSATKEGNKFLDAHSLSDAHNEQIKQWALKNDYLAQQETVTVCYYDDEMEDDLCSTFNSMADAEAEYDEELEYMDVTVEKGGIVPTDKLKKETRQNRIESTGVLEFVLPIFAEQQGLDGVWWQDKLDVQRYSAPRGVIVPSKIKSWKFSVNETTAFNESLNNPYPFNLTGPSESQEFSAIAKTPNGVLRMDFETTDYDNFGIDFSVGKSMGKTDAGDEFRVFATVVAMMTKWIKTVGIKHVESFDFGANKGEHASDGRAKLYTRFAKQLASKLGWKLEQSTTRDNNTAFFRLVNPKPIPREQEYWDALDEGVEVSLHGDAKKGYVLSKIEVSGDERNAGQGTKAMQDIVDRMDREGAIIALTPDDAFGGNKNRLIKFYKRFGFVSNKGRNKDFRFRETMIRYPQTNESVNEVSKEEFDAIQNGYVDIEFDKKWWPLNDDYPLIKHIGNAIGATSWTSWGKVGVPWSETEMIGGGGTYMLKGDFGHILLDTAKSYRPDKIVMSQISTSKRGGGIGAKVMNAIKSYSDQNKLPLTIYKVTNQKFFDKFEWLEKTGVDTYEYNSNEVKESAGVGRVVKGVNTTVDVGVDEIINQVKKFGNDVDRDGKPKKNLRNK